MQYPEMCAVPRDVSLLMRGNPVPAVFSGPGHTPTLSRIELTVDHVSCPAPQSDSVRACLGQTLSISLTTRDDRPEGLEMTRGGHTHWR